jgi:hypothetical protein
MYVTFILLAIYGRTREADALMHFAGDSIRLVADELSKRRPFETKPLYRGALLDPGVEVALDPRLAFLSWSEDKDVARWFADPQSAMSGLLAFTQPRSRGFLFEMPQAGSRVLWHHSWAKVFGGAGKLAFLGRENPLIGMEGVNQIHWSLTTQQEVITEPSELPAPRRFEDTKGASLMELEQRLLPPWLRSDE